MAMKEEFVRYIDNEGRVVIPAPFRKILGLKKNSKMQIRVKGEEIILRAHENTCMVTGEVSDENYELLDGQLILSHEGVKKLHKTLERWISE